MSKRQSAFTLKPLDNGVAVIEINVIEDAQNTLKAEFADDFDALLDEVRQLKPTALVAISTKEDSFIAVADINMFDSKDSSQAFTDLSLISHRCFQQLEDLNIPVVAAIDGACLGGGMEFALACSWRIAATSANTVLGLPEVMLGLLPAGGGTQRLPRTVGIANALDLMLTGRQLRPKPAVKMGLIDETCEPVALYDRAVARALALAEANEGTGVSVTDYLNKDAITKAALEQNPLGRKVVLDQARK